MLEARCTGDMILFAQVVEAGTITGGSKRIGLERSTVSRRLTSLEDRLGVSLLQRSTRKLRLTEIGRQYYKHCVRVLEAAEDAEAIARHYCIEPNGLLMIGSSLCEADRFLVEVVAEFSDRYALVQVGLDLGIEVDEAALQRSDVFLNLGLPHGNGVAGIGLGRVRHSLWASAEFLQRMPIHESPSLLHQAASICLASAAESVRWRLQSATDSVQISVLPRFRMKTLAACRDACVAGLGVAMLPDYLCCEAEQSGDLRRVYSDWTVPGEQLYALQSENRFLTRNAKVFTDFLRTHLSRANQ